MTPMKNFCLDLHELQGMKTGTVHDLIQSKFAVDASCTDASSR